MLGIGPHFNFRDVLPSQTYSAVLKKLNLTYQIYDTQLPPPFYGHYIGQPALTGEDGAKFYCPHAPADSNYCAWIRKKMLEFSSTVLPAPSLYHAVTHKSDINDRNKEEDKPIF